MFIVFPTTAIQSKHAKLKVTVVTKPIHSYFNLKSAGTEAVIRLDYLTIRIMNFFFSNYKIQAFCLLLQESLLRNVNLPYLPDSEYETDQVLCVSLQ